MSESTQTPISTSTRLIVDTNVAIDLINHPQESIARIGGGVTLHAPTIVLGELYFGACKSSNVDVNISRVEAFANSVNILLVDLLVARRFGQLQQKLRTKGKPIPPNDLWIAATALANNLPLLTRDSHFGHIDDLQTIRW